MLFVSTKMSEKLLHWDTNYNNFTRCDIRKSRVVQELEEKRMKERLAEELECQKKFKAQAVPEFVRVPMYDDVIRHQEERKLIVKQRSKDLLQMVKPFSFVERHNVKIAERNTKNKYTKEDKYFKASPFPSKIFEPSFEEKIKEKETARRSATEIRKRVLLESSFTPKSIIEHDKLVEKRETMTKNILLDLLPNGAKTFRPKINHEVPNFDVIHQKVLKQKASNKVLNTKCVPFNFETDQRKKKHHEKERKASSTSLNSARTFSRLLSTSMDAIPIVATKTSVLRAKNSKKQNDETKRLAELMARKAHIKEIRNRNLERAVRERSAVHDPTVGRISSAKSREYIERTQQYMRELNEMNKRVNNRPLLFEQMIEKNERLLAEKKYHKILDVHQVQHGDLNKLINIDDVIGISNDMKDSWPHLIHPTNRSRHNDLEMDGKGGGRISHASHKSIDEIDKQDVQSSVESEKIHLPP